MDTVIPLAGNSMRTLLKMFEIKVTVPEDFDCRLNCKRVAGEMSRTSYIAWKLIRHGERELYRVFGFEGKAEALLGKFYANGSLYDSKPATAEKVYLVTRVFRRRSKLLPDDATECWTRVCGIIVNRR